MENVTILGMFLLGLMTSLSPCSIAILVATVSFIIGESKNLKQGLILGISFTAGLSLVFFIFGLFVSYLGQFVRYSHIFFAVAGITLIYFGMQQLGIFKDLLGKRNSISFVQQFGFKIMNLPIVISSFLLGVLFALGWAPCATALIMPAIVYIMAKEITVFGGSFLLFIFGLGHGVPVIPLALLGGTVREKLQIKIVKAGNIITKLIAILMILTGLIIAVFGPKLVSLIK
ncbi:MAG: cytochrome c biogenesis CcdA family protein [Candidatus Omnitrophica bacterium]|nr:cytochrome c biogenesis CcdA family protein [Candidatus Omnitrophota bacterium]MCM8809003.1 cytochrome c biogenesis CcdA family protein [Candidatus Omnitrophota bacterium]MCM8811257.1 cytochrome c biogenesis CcdA family protein [Candidatus Omnitrophota bacterium]